MHQELTLYIDISQFIRTRKTTGIQRVIREFLSRTIGKTPLYILDANKTNNTFIQLDNREVLEFFQDVPNYTFKTFTPIKLCDAKEANKVFLELDTVWNAPIKREALYPKLKKSGFKIANLIYDLIPLLFPQYLYKESQENFPKFIESVQHYSDLVILNSHSAQKDFKALQTKREVPTALTPLGANYATQNKAPHTKYKELLTQNYILFVGTIEPRKEQLKLLEVYEEIQKEHPDLHLVFIGKIGWNVQEFTQKYMMHPLKDTKVHHFTEIDDATLAHFYKNAFLVTYLSKYEGFGLPLIESLSFANVTIASNNSSMSEQSEEYIDFVKDASHLALKELLLHYIQNPHLRQSRKEKIKKGYNPTTWNDFHINLLEIIENFAILQP